MHYSLPRRVNAYPPFPLFLSRIALLHHPARQPTHLSLLAHRFPRARGSQRRLLLAALHRMGHFSTIRHATMDTQWSLAEATKCLMKFINTGAIGPINGTFKMYSIVQQSAADVTFMAALISVTVQDPPPPDRYIIKIDPRSGTVLSSELASITRAELEAICAEAGIGPVETSQRYKDGSFSVSYKVVCGESTPYIVQLRSNGNLDTIHAVHDLVTQKHPQAIPTPKLFKTTVVPRAGLPVQISAFVDGVMADVAYSTLGLSEKSQLLKHVARAFEAVWSLIPLPPDSEIGEALIDPATHALSVGPDRRYRMGGPFQSVSSFLEAWIRRSVRMLQEQEAVDEYKSKYLDRILRFTATMPACIPECVNQVPIVTTHADMGLHNMILSSHPPHNLEAIIDWEFFYCYPFPYSVSCLIEPLFSDLSETEIENGAEETLRAAFWGEIPFWRHVLSLEHCKIFQDFFNFGLYLKVEAVRGPKTTVETHWQAWERNCRVVDAFLSRYGPSPSAL